jgi:hypothetical protein
MIPLRYTLLADGTADKRLLPVVSWTLSQHTTRPILSTWSDLYFVQPKPRSLVERVLRTVELFPADLLVVHRDAENADPNDRLLEVDTAVAKIAFPAIALIPVRMQEAWLLFNEGAIRRAADNPNGTAEIELPKLSRVEEIPDPKEVLFQALRVASGKTGRRLTRFNEERAAHRLADLINDFSPLRALPAFQSFEHRVREFCQAG